MQSLATPAPTNSQPASDEEEYNEHDLESTYLVDASLGSEASYFERAQDFQSIIKTLRIKYLGLVPRTKKMENGDEVLVYRRDPSKMVGINKKGVEAIVRFLEPRLGKHIALTNWGEKERGEKRMFTVMSSDMEAFFAMMVQNIDEYELTDSMLFEAVVVVNDLLEVVYRRGIGDEERNKMRPTGKEIRRLLGLDKDEERETPSGLSTSALDKMRRDAQM